MPQAACEAVTESLRYLRDVGFWTGGTTLINGLKPLDWRTLRWGMVGGGGSSMDRLYSPLCRRCAITLFALQAGAFDMMPSADASSASGWGGSDRCYGDYRKPVPQREAARLTAFRRCQLPRQ